MHDHFVASPLQIVAFRMLSCFAASFGSFSPSIHSPRDAGPLRGRAFAHCNLPQDACLHHSLAFCIVPSTYYLPQDAWPLLGLAFVCCAFFPAPPGWFSTSWSYFCSLRLQVTSPQNACILLGLSFVPCAFVAPWLHFSLLYLQRLPPSGCLAFSQPRFRPSFLLLSSLRFFRPLLGLVNSLSHNFFILRILCRFAISLCPWDLL